MRKLIIAAMVLSFFSVVDYSLGFANDIETELLNVSDKSLYFLAAGKTDEAFSLLDKYWPNLTMREKANKKYIYEKQFEKVTPSLGALKRIRRLKKQNFETIYYRFEYLSEHEYSPLHWVISFYVTDDRLFLDKIFFDNDLGFLLDK